VDFDGKKEESKVQRSRFMGNNQLRVNKPLHLLKPRLVAIRVISFPKA
jgi:hypothetical protein